MQFDIHLNMILGMPFMAHIVIQDRCLMMWFRICQVHWNSWISNTTCWNDSSSINVILDARMEYCLQLAPIEANQMNLNQPHLNQMHLHQIHLNPIYQNQNNLKNSYSSTYIITLSNTSCWPNRSQITGMKRSAKVYDYSIVCNHSYQFKHFS